MDVKDTFLQGDLHEEVYMQPPHGVKALTGYVCRLRRTLYGLKQAPHAWFQSFSSVTQATGFTVLSEVATAADPISARCRLVRPGVAVASSSLDSIGFPPPPPPTREELCYPSSVVCSIARGVCSACLSPLLQLLCISTDCFCL